MTEPKIAPHKIITGTVAAGGTSTSPSIQFGRNSGFFSCQSTLTGTGTAKIQFQVSNDGVNYNTGSTDIVTAQTAGTAMYSYAAMPSIYQRILVTETGSANSVSLTMTLAVQ